MQAQTKMELQHMIARGGKERGPKKRATQRNSPRQLFRVFFIMPISTSRTVSFWRFKHRQKSKQQERQKEKR